MRCAACSCRPRRMAPAVALDSRQARGPWPWLARAPITATHSSCRPTCPRPRRSHLTRQLAVGVEHIARSPAPHAAAHAGQHVPGTGDGGEAAAPLGAGPAGPGHAAAGRGAGAAAAAARSSPPPGAQRAGSCDGGKGYQVRVAGRRSGGALRRRGGGGADHRLPRHPPHAGRPTPSPGPRRPPIRKRALPGVLCTNRPRSSVRGGLPRAGMTRQTGRSVRLAGLHARRRHARRGAAPQALISL